MRYSVSVASKLRLVFLFGVCFMMLVVFVVPAKAQDTTVNVAVCGTGAGAQLTIDQPANDSVVGQSSVPMSGLVANATQIDITIDGQYNSTVPLSAQQTAYNTEVQLTAGTHTIELVANDVCQTQDATASIVITYQPQTTPSTGGDTPTTINSGGTVIDGEGVTPGSGDRIGPENWPVIGPLVRLGRDLAIALDFETGKEGGESTLLRSVLRCTFIVVGVSTLLFGTSLIAWRRRSRAVLSTRARWIIAFLGIAIAAIAFTI